MTFIRLTNKHADRILWAGFVFVERHDDDRLRPSDTDPTLVYSPSGDEFTVTESLDAIAAMLGGKTFPSFHPDLRNRGPSETPDEPERDLEKVIRWAGGGVGDEPVTPRHVRNSILYHLRRNTPWHATADGLPVENTEVCADGTGGTRPEKMKVNKTGVWFVWDEDDEHWCECDWSPTHWAYFPEEPDVSSPPGRHEGTPMGETTPAPDPSESIQNSRVACDTCGATVPISDAVRYSFVDRVGGEWKCKGCHQPSVPDPQPAPAEAKSRDPDWRRCVKCAKKIPYVPPYDTCLSCTAGPAEAKGEWTVSRRAADGWWLNSPTGFGVGCFYGDEERCAQAAAALNRKPMGVERVRAIIAQWVKDEYADCGYLDGKEECLDQLARRIAEATCPPTN